MSALARQRAFAETRTDYFVFSPVRQRSRAKTFELVPAASACISIGMQHTDPPRPFIADEAALLIWAEMAPPGACAIYHVGHLASDRSADMSNLGAAARGALNSIAHRVMGLVERGALLAVQQRLDDGRVAYLAIESRRPPSRSRTARGPEPRTVAQPLLSRAAGAGVAAAA